MLRDIGAPEAAETDEAMALDGHADHRTTRCPAWRPTTSSSPSPRSSGAEADELFVDLMIAHHQGGLHMAEFAAAEAENAEVRSLAPSIVDGQQGEIVELEDRPDGLALVNGADGAATE